MKSWHSKISDNVNKVPTMPIPPNTERFAGINLKIKRPFKARDSEHLFEIKMAVAIWSLL